MLEDDNENEDDSTTNNDDSTRRFFNQTTSRRSRATTPVRSNSTTGDSGDFYQEFVTRNAARVGTSTNTNTVAHPNNNRKSNTNNTTTISPSDPDAFPFDPLEVTSSATATASSSSLEKFFATEEAVTNLNAEERNDRLRNNHNHNADNYNHSNHNTITAAFSSSSTATPTNIKSVYTSTPFAVNNATTATATLTAAMAVPTAKTDSIISSSILDDEESSDPIDFTSVELTPVPTNSNNRGTTNVTVLVEDVDEDEENEEEQYAEEDTNNKFLQSTVTHPRTGLVHTTTGYPGAAGYLEIEPEPARPAQPPSEDTGGSITTNSGLVLTHRKTTRMTKTANTNTTNRSVIRAAVSSSATPNQYFHQQQQHPLQEQQQQQQLPQQQYPQPEDPWQQPPPENQEQQLRNMYPNYNPTASTISNSPQYEDNDYSSKKDTFEVETDFGGGRSTVSSRTVRDGQGFRHRWNTQQAPTTLPMTLRHHRDRIQHYFGGSSGAGTGGYSGGGGRHPAGTTVLRGKRLLRAVQLWMVLFALLLLSMTGTFFHSLQHKEAQSATTKNSSSSSNDPSTTTVKTITTATSEIVLLPLENVAQISASLQQQNRHKVSVLPEQQQQPYPPQPGSLQLVPIHQPGNPPRRLLQDSVGKELYRRRRSDSSTTDEIRSASSLTSLSTSLPHPFHHSATGLVVLDQLRTGFEEWMVTHQKQYPSDHEKQHRFRIWSHNQERTKTKNQRHGPCTLTKQHVFRANHLQDLSPEEFAAKFLTGYKGAVYTDVRNEQRQQQQQKKSPDPFHRSRHDRNRGTVLNPKVHKPNIHESVRAKQRHLSTNNQHNSDGYSPQVMGSSSMNCQWYDLSCVLRYIWKMTGIQFGTLTMEPKYDADAFPNTVDWRDSGAITDVRTQGECGACWAVTAVETMESAYYLATGTLYELSESEIIVCDESCEMCSGGWPQNAYDWAMDHGGLPLRNTFPYDAYTLIALTAGVEGESEYYNEDSIASYRSAMCPADDDGNSGSGSGSTDNYWEDNVENGNYADYSDQGRYGNIKGYGYATDRCLCYTDGSGCDCEDQDEDTAIANIATYGPSVVCLEASTWQDYGGGIITADSGCGQEFLDMNHCVQVVGYAFTDGSSCNGGGGSGSEDNNNEDCDDGNNQSGSGSGSNSGSNDSGGRDGYWIVRNQWGKYPKSLLMGSGIHPFCILFLLLFSFSPSFI